MFNNINNEPNVEQILKEIENRKPNIVIVEGSTNRTYSSSSYYNVLVIKENNKYEFGMNLGFSKVELTISQWIIKKLEYIYTKLEIIKFNGFYFIDYNYTNPPDYSEVDGSLYLDGGGIISVYKF